MPAAKIDLSSFMTDTANTMSNTTVRPKQVKSTITSLRGAMRRSRTKWRASLMLRATMNKSAAMPASGR